MTLRYWKRYPANPGHTRGWRKHYLSSIALHWQMKTLLGIVLKDKQMERYIVFASLEDIKRMLRNQCFFMELDVRLAHVEGHLQCDFDTFAPHGLGAKESTPISSSNS